MTTKKIVITLAAILSFLYLSSSLVCAAGFSSLNDCLVTNDTGKYIYDVKTARIGNAAGVVGRADHFKVDHVDSICSGEYSNINEVRSFQTREEIVNHLVSVKVQVTQHTGGDSDRWLLHELDKSFRTSLGIPGKAYGQRTINGQSILESGAGGRTYRWISGNKIINIEYTDAQMTKPEPLEVVPAYLAKHPSTIASLTLKQLRNSENVTKWIKDEMDRRLWLCDKWNMQYQAGSATQADLLPKLLESMTVFLDYRQKYFNVSAEDDNNTLRSYLENNNTSGFQTKLKEYKTWWAKHKEKRISL